MFLKFSYSGAYSKQSKCAFVEFYYVCIFTYVLCSCETWKVHNFHKDISLSELNLIIEYREKFHMG